jgi:Domain of unknown function (DUF6048)
MSIQSTCRYIFILIISASFVCCSPRVYAQYAPPPADTTATDSTSEHKVKKVDSAGHQLSFGIDLVRPVLNHYATDRFGYEFAADYYLRNEFYAVAEGGWGGSTVDYVDLKYTTTNDFFRLGFNKSILGRDGWRDWDMMFFGLRAGYADVKRSDAGFSVVDSLWGTTSGLNAPGKTFPVLWMEITGGMRVELAKGLSAGWTIRGKFLLNGKSFSDLAPLYIAGYGKGDKNANFDFNVYLSYAIRWKRKSIIAQPTAPLLPASPADKPADPKK